MIAARAKRVYPFCPLPVEDLVQEGNIGLCKALEKFDFNRGNNFLTYAAWWVKQSIYHAASTRSEIVDLPAHCHIEMKRLSRALQSFHQQHGRNPTDTELAKELGISIKSLNTIQQAIAMRYGDSLQRQLTTKDSEGSELQSFIPNPDSPNPEDETISAQRTEMIGQAIDKLFDIDRRMPRMIRLIMAGYNLDQIGKKFGICRERVRQLKERALIHLKNYLESRGISYQQL